MPSMLWRSSTFSTSPLLKATVQDLHGTPRLGAAVHVLAPTHCIDPAPCVDGTSASATSNGHVGQATPSGVSSQYLCRLQRLRFPTISVPQPAHNHKLARGRLPNDRGEVPLLLRRGHGCPPARRERVGSRPGARSHPDFSLQAANDGEPDRGWPLEPAAEPLPRLSPWHRLHEPTPEAEDQAPPELTLATLPMPCRTSGFCSSKSPSVQSCQHH